MGRKWGRNQTEQTDGDGDRYIDRGRQRDRDGQTEEAERNGEEMGDGGWNE